MRGNKYLSLILLIILIGIHFYLGNEENSTLGEYRETTIIKVIDGDTVLSSDGEKIRIIGINTPEISKKESLSMEAKYLAENILLNKRVFIEKDIEEFDRYGRTLGYIWVEVPDKVNRKSIEKLNYSGIALKFGLARVYTFKPNDKYREFFIDIQKNAIKNKIGMWEYSEEGTTRGNSLK
ncbi:micrococcal nuclease [Peptoniphilus asaccharolyticus DSM 20463]|uniref:Micrococcal nuclease n=1 Tax=Peptoniphilus asaccharolyticus DSM 20463 TaxID=573058 RepID=A0A1W1VIF0_PEPAS|nr:thermonuclease family protein [Peptoniphilus asaccharolyticus]MBL7574288.1 thermonuclease family protein [Peptoniphilus asaccharolyticus]SMB92724.1 micrococcal nuclease [Peptoniphilus asaccharolyticus DSM 20463]